MKRTILITIVILVWTNGLNAQRKTIVSKDTTLSDGFIGMSPTGDSIFRRVHFEAEFPGGAAGWKSYLEQNLDASLGDRYIKIPIGRLYAKATVALNFQVSKEGDVFDVKADSLSIATVHKKLVAEAIRIIKESPRWSPAWQNGHRVAYRAKQSISFVSRNTLD